MILRFCICIPTYNNPASIEGVVKDCLQQTPYPILIVDDGSVPPVSLPFEDPRVKTLRTQTNQGKGVALQLGIQNCIVRGFTHMISIDGDGQHLATEIQKLTQISIENPWDMVIGSRRLHSVDVPKISKFGRKFSNFWVQFQTHQSVTDSQSGFRIYPLFHVQNLKFWTRKFDFEIEVLIRLLWRGVQVRETEIDCFYPAPSERVSHFHKFWDNARISILNSILVVLSLLRTRRSAGEIGIAVGVGVWIGTTPFFGFHTFIAAVFAFFFRINAVYLLIGTQISIPLLAPILALASIAIGKRMSHSTAHTAARFSWNWLSGSMILGAGLGLLIGLLSYFFARRMQSNPAEKNSTWNGKTRGGSFGNWFLKSATRWGGLKTAYAFLYLVIPYFYLFAPKARRSAAEYWKITHPEMGMLKRQSRILKHLFRFAQILLDRVYQGFHPEPCFGIHSNGLENILEPIRAGKGLILMSGHIGGWDMAAATLKADGLGKPFHMIKYESEGMTFDKARNQTDPEHVKRIFSNQVQQPVLQVREILSQGLPVGLMGDRPNANQFELIPFFGKLAPIDCTPFRIAAVCEVPLLFTFGFKGAASAYDFYATPSRHYKYSSGKDKSLQLLEWAQDYTRELERILGKYPEQWFNFFPFWSALPVLPEGVTTAKARNHSLEELNK